MEWLHCCLCYCSLCHHNAVTIAAVTSQWGTHWGALSNQVASLLVLPMSNNSHDINWIKLEFLMNEIIILSYLPIKQHIRNTVKFSMHDKREKICCCGIWEQITWGWRKVFFIYHFSTYSNHIWGNSLSEIIMESPLQQLPASHIWQNFQISNGSSKM